MLLAQGIIPTYVPKFIEELESPTEPPPRNEGRDDMIRRLKVYINSATVAD